jgi:hypothetical protein
MEKIPAPPLENPDPAFWTAKLDTLLKKKEIRNLRISKSFYFSIKALRICMFSNPRDWN